MLSPPSLFIGLRYTRSKRRHQFTSFVSGFSLIGMGLGTLALLLVLSVMNGFDREIKQRILSVVPHGFVDQQPRMGDWRAVAEKIMQQPDIVASAPYISGFVMLSSRQGVYGVELQGILPQQEQQVSVIHHYMQAAQLDSQAATLGVLRDGEFGIVLGSLVARYLNVGIGDSVTMTLPQVSITPAGIFPRVKRFKVSDIFEVGAQVDQSLALIHLNDAQRLFRYGTSVQGLRIQVDDIYKAGEVAASLPLHLGSDTFVTRDWSQTQGSLFQAIKLEKRVVTLLLMIIIAVAALNIVTSLVLMVADKRSDIAVLRTLGMSTQEIMCVFIFQGSAVGIVGVLIGGILGCIVAVNISAIVAWFEGLVGAYVFDPDVYFISGIPSQLRFEDVIFVCGTGLLLSIGATIYPAYRATRVAPAEVLRYE
ncbi:MAG: lipoprotein-releasing ABC transporter permease subunit [Pseudomonadota bacterium]